MRESLQSSYNSTSDQSRFISTWLSYTLFHRQIDVVTIPFARFLRHIRFILPLFRSRYMRASTFLGGWFFAQTWVACWHDGLRSLQGEESRKEMEEGTQHGQGRRRGMQKEGYRGRRSSFEEMAHGSRLASDAIAMAVAIWRSVHLYDLELIHLTFNTRLMLIFALIYKVSLCVEFISTRY